MSQANGSRALLCELHAHTTWSDGELTLRELADLYGRAGFDVLCVTDHVLRSADPWRVPESCVHEASFASYLTEIDREAERCRALYGMLVVPGVELTHNHREPDLSAHALAIGLREFVSPDLGLVGALLAAREAGAALIAAHPHGPEEDLVPARTTRRFWREWDTLAPLVHRVELINRWDVYGWAATGELPAVASGDTHSAGHLSSWKTLVPCEAGERALVSYLRSGRATYLVPFRAAAVEASVAAA
jgi:predicted metal-dependent phosphoesterase TrpH